MCIAILNSPQGGTISQETLLNCWKANSHGAGYAFAKDDALYIYKNVKSFQSFYKSYKSDRKQNPDANFMIHFRIKTHGKVDRKNTHPFGVNNHLAFCHNGIIDGYGTDEKSDTVEFNEKVLMNMPEDFIDYEGCRRLIRKCSGWSKFIFLKSNNEYRIINEEGGFWVDGNWFSNRTYQSCGFRDIGGKQVAFNTSTTYYAPDEDSEKQNWKAYRGAIDAFDGEGYPKETNDKPKKIRKASGYKNWPESRSSNFTEDLTNDLPFDVPEESETKGAGRFCSECYEPLKDRMENHYGVCTKCLKNFEIIPS